MRPEASTEHIYHTVKCSKETGVSRLVEILLPLLQLVERLQRFSRQNAADLFDQLNL